MNILARCLGNRVDTIEIIGELQFEGNRFRQRLVHILPS